VEDPGGEVKRRKRRPQRREEILEAAIDLFHEKGYNSTSLDDVAGVVGIAGPSIYRHFGSKLEILDAALHQGGHHVLDAVEEVTSAGGPPAEVLARLARDLITAVLRKPKLSGVVLRERRHLPPESREWLDRSYRLMTEEWVHQLLRLRPELADEQARLVVRSTLSMIYATGDHVPRQSPPGTVDLIFDMAMAALLGAKSSGPVT
jgi:AcrR family transcriptional regulator